MQKIYSEMSEGDKAFTTYAVAKVKVRGKTEYWIAAAGRVGYDHRYARVPTKLQNVMPDNTFLIFDPHAIPDDLTNSIGRFIGTQQHKLWHVNDAERHLLRMLKSQRGALLAIGATRPYCSRCQKVLSARHASKLVKFRPFDE